MSETTASKEKISVAERFNQMNFPPGMDSNSLALTWIKEHKNTFCGFSKGQWLSEEALKDLVSNITLHKVVDHFTGKHLCDVHVAPVTDFLSCKSSEIPNFKDWASKSSAALRSKILYSIAQAIEKYQNLFAVVESVSSGKHISKVKTKDIPNLIESFYYYAGCAYQLQEKSKAESWFPMGHVLVIADEYNNPCLSLSLQVSSVLAAGNSVTILADWKSCLSAFLLAEVCSEAGLPGGILDVFSIDHHQYVDGIVGDVSKILLVNSGSSQIYAALNRISNVPCDVLLPRRPVVIIYKDADLHAAAESAIEAFAYQDTRCRSGGCKLIVQQSIAAAFLKILEEKFSKLLVGSNFSKTDMSCIVTEEQKKELAVYLANVEKHAKVIKSDVGNLNYTHMQPVLVSDVQPGFKLVDDELGGPIIVAITFRTEKESISMFNSDNKGSPVSIWTDKISVALEVAQKLKTGTVWVNSQNVISSRIAFSSTYSSGNSVEGGMNAFFSHLVTDANYPKSNDGRNVSDSPLLPVVPRQNISSNITEYKLYIGGAMKRPDKILVKDNIVIPCGSEADISSAVSVAGAAQPKWEMLTKHQRSQVLISIAKNLDKRGEEFVAELRRVTEFSLEECKKEVSDAVNILFYWAFQTDNYSGQIEEISKYKVLQSRNAQGTVGIQCPNTKPLLSFLLLVAPAVSFGNAVVALVSNTYPTPALKMCEIFSISGVPNGVINVINFPDGNYLYKNNDIHAMWYTDIRDPTFKMHYVGNQRTFDMYGIWENFNEAKSLKCVMASTFIKSIYLPSGEIFAN